MIFERFLCWYQETLAVCHKKSHLQRQMRPLQKLQWSRCYQDHLCIRYYQRRQTPQNADLDLKKVFRLVPLWNKCRKLEFFRELRCNSMFSFIVDNFGSDMSVCSGKCWAVCFRNEYAWSFYMTLFEWSNFNISDSSGKRKCMTTTGVRIACRTVTKFHTIKNFGLHVNLSLDLFSF